MKLLTDYIRTFNKILDPVICNDLIAYYKENGAWEKSTFSYALGSATYKSNSPAAITQNFRELLIFCIQKH